jgi:hypothetical protein
MTNGHPRILNFDVISERSPAESQDEEQEPPTEGATTVAGGNQ